MPYTAIWTWFSNLHKLIDYCIANYETKVEQIMAKIQE